MLLVIAVSFLGGILGGFLASFFSKPLKSAENGPTLKGMPTPGRSRTQKRTPRALTDLMAYNNEIKNEGENRG